MIKFVWLGGVIVCLTFLTRLMISDYKKDKSNVTIKDVEISIVISLFSWIGVLIIWDWKKYE